VKQGDPFARGDIDCCPQAPLATQSTLGCPDRPRHPYLPKGAKGPGTDAQPSCRSTDDPTAQSEHVRRVHWAKRLAIIFGTAGARARSKRPLETLTRPRWCAVERGNRSRSSLALRHPCCPIYPRHPRPAQGGEGARERCLNHRVAVDRPSRSSPRVLSDADRHDAAARGSCI